MNLFFLGRTDATQQLSCYSSNIEQSDVEYTWLAVSGSSNEVEDPPEGALKLMLDSIEKIDYGSEKKAITNDAVEYLAGYLIYKEKCDIRCIEEVNDETELSYVDIVNRGGLKKPPKAVVNKVHQLEKMFRSTPITTNDLYNAMISQSNVNMPHLMKLRYFKTRVFSRIRYLNRQMITYKTSKKNLRASINVIKSPFGSNKTSKIKRKIKKLSTYMIFSIHLFTFNYFKYILI